MSHELRTPLTAIRGSMNYLERTLKDKENLNYIQIIEKNTSRLTRLISNLFDFTKLEAGKIEWEFESHNISQLVKEVIEILSPISLNKKITIDLDCTEEIYAIIDLERIEQVLVNLLDNAIKFSQNESTIQIKVKKDKNNAVISINDQGPGIAHENLETIFKKFYTAATISEDGRKGAGMGLAISKAIIKGHNGTIWAESTKGVSSTFYVSLPLEEKR